MKANWKSLLFIITVVIVGGLFFTFLYGQKQERESANSIITPEGEVAGVTTIEGSYTDKLAKDLRDKGMVLFGSYQSSDTAAQLALFNGSAKYLDYVECDASGPSANPDECVYTNIQGLAELAKIVGFSE
jgi:hypothetical protein